MQNCWTKENWSAFKTCFQGCVFLLELHSECLEMWSFIIFWLIRKRQKDLSWLSTTQLFLSNNLPQVNYRNGYQMSHKFLRDVKFSSPTTKYGIPFTPSTSWALPLPSFYHNKQGQQKITIAYFSLKTQWFCDERYRKEMIYLRSYDRISRRIDLVEPIARVIKKLCCLSASFFSAHCRRKSLQSNCKYLLPPKS